jgi:short-subunit dehydrogenase
MSMKGEVGVVTGAAGGIGRPLCRLLAAEGCRLGLIGRTAATLDAVAEELRQGGAKVSVRVADVGDRTALTAALAGIEADLGPVDVLVHNAGVARVTDARRPDLDDLEEMLRVNYLGGVYALEAVLPGMMARGRGRVGVISSLGARRGMAWSAGYSASKAALGTYMESLRPALRKRGISVTTVFLGFVDTPMTAALPLGLPVRLMRPEKAARRIVRGLKRGQREVSCPWEQAWGTAVLRRLPTWLFDLCMSTVGRLAIKGEY